MKEAEDVFAQLETDEPGHKIHDLPYVFALYCNPRGYAYLYVLSVRYLAYADTSMITQDEMLHIPSQNVSFHEDRRRSRLF